MRFLMILLAVLVMGAGALPAGAELVHQWSLDELSGATAADSVSGADGRLQGDRGAGGSIDPNNLMPRHVPGYRGRALLFDGYDDGAYVGDAESGLFNSMTMTCWAKLDGVQPAWTMALCNRYDDYFGMMLSTGYPATANELGYDWLGNSGWTWHSGIVVPQDRWVFLAVVADGANQQVTVYLYDNGAVSSTTRTGVWIMPQRLDNFYIGRDQYSPGRSFKGLLDEARIYNAALSNSELQDIAEGVGEYVSVDDFETYADTTGLQTVWTDGTGNGSSAAVALETMIDNVYQGDQAAVLSYNNAGGNYAEVSRAVTGDWSGATTKALSIWVKGDPANAAEPLYVALEDGSSNVAVQVVADAAIAQADQWTEVNLALADFAGVDLANVGTLHVGLGDRDNPQVGGSGQLLIDQISLYPPRCLEAPTADVDGDCDVDIDDLAELTGQWLQTGVVPAP